VQLICDDGLLDDALTVRDGDVVLVPHGYHSASVPPGTTSTT
jgi:5-deoxy-D-glucuronate isomerase